RLLCAFSAGPLVFERDDRPWLSTVAARAFSSRTEVVQGDDVVATQHRVRPMAGEGHRRVRIDPGVDEVSHAAAPKVVDDPAVRPDRLAGGLPGLPEVPDRLAVVVEDELAVEAA